MAKRSAYPTSMMWLIDPGDKPTAVVGAVCEGVSYYRRKYGAVHSIQVRDGVLSLAMIHLIEKSTGVVVECVDNIACNLVYIGPIGGRLPVVYRGEYAPVREWEAVNAH